MNTSTEPRSPAPSEREALRALLAKIDSMMPFIDAMAVDVHVHGRPYNGPTWEKEIAAARVALAAPPSNELSGNPGYLNLIPPAAPVPAEPTDALRLARLFHETYERLAPSFGYETRDDTKVFDPTSKNGRLMVAVCAAVSQARGETP